MTDTVKNFLRERARRKPRRDYEQTTTTYRPCPHCGGRSD